MSKVYGFTIEAVDGKIDLLNINSDTAQRLAHMFASLLDQCGCYSKFYIHVNKDNVGFEIERSDEKGNFDPVSRSDKLKETYKESFEGISHL